ncbi:RNA polymerase sigma factor [Oribacterium sp. P9]|uniref:RNA polymerase sigma factor n=1 Tax=Oribacterium sp. P9 TaxID=3378068 RepID=UPI0039679855
MDNLQTNKKYFIPMEVTSETIKAFNINAEDVQWSRIGNKKVKAIMVPATEEQYYAYMRPLWREDKQNQRASKQEEAGKMKPVSLDQLYEDTKYETVDPVTDVEATLMKRLLIAELHKALDELEEIDRTIMEMYSQDYTETQIGQAVGMSQRGVGKRKQRILLKLRTRLKDFR